MLKLTAKQLREAIVLASNIVSLEAAKDKCGDLWIELDVGDFRGDYIKVRAPKEPVLRELADRIKAAHASLAAMGIELAPGGIEKVSNG